MRCPTLFLDEGGVVKGSVAADRVRVSGLVDGGIEAGDLAIESTGRVLGSASYARFKVSAGGVIEGTLSHRPEHEAQTNAPLKLVEGDQGPKPRRMVYGD